MATAKVRTPCSTSLLRLQDPASHGDVRAAVVGPFAFVAHVLPPASSFLRQKVVARLVSVRASPAAAFNDVDVRFTQGMVPHHMQVVRYAEIEIAMGA